MYEKNITTPNRNPQGNQIQPTIGWRYNPFVSDTVCANHVLGGVVSSTVMLYMEGMAPI